MKVVDKDGVTVNLKDKVVFNMKQEDMFSAGEVKKVEGIVICLLSEELVQVQPKDTPAMEVPTSSLKVVDSIINSVRALSSEEEVQKVILEAEKRYEEEVANGTRKKASSPRTSKKKVVKGGTLKL